MAQLRRITMAALCGTGLLLAAGQANAQCDPSRLMVVLDQSSSMVSGTIGGVTKWSIAVDALDDVTTSFEDKLQLGLMKYPAGTVATAPNECTPGTVLVDPDLGQKASIMANLSEVPPNPGNWTPMFQTLDAAATAPSLQQDDVPNYVVLITDGWQYCADVTTQPRFAAVSSVTRLLSPVAANGDPPSKVKKVYVVGFGNSVDALTLNRMAVEGAGGVPPIAGCDPTGDTPDAANPCYYQADDAQELLDALNEIADNATEEICDGLDNDCQNGPDDNLVQSCSSACGAGIETCTNGNWGGCNAPQPAPFEVCDEAFEDENCDGSANEGCDCVPGETRDCGETEDTGICQPGTQTCDGDGKWGTCEGSVGPNPYEECNGEDDDCDGSVDESVADGEVFQPLCGAGFECIDGNCDPVDPMDAPDETGSLPAADGSGGSAAGCACRTASGGGFAGASLLAIFGLAVTFRRRRRRQ